MPPGAFLRWGASVYLGLAVGAVVWLGLRDGVVSASLFFRPESWLADLGLGLAAAALLAGGWQLGLVFLESARKLERLVAATVGRLAPSEAVVLALLSGFSEELFFRGAVQSQWGLVPATLLFAVLHLGPGREFRLWTLFALVAGALLGALVWWRATLLAAIVAHVVVNAVGLLRLRRMAGDLEPETP